jgi:hypothetical protein
MRRRSQGRAYRRYSRNDVLLAGKTQSRGFSCRHTPLEVVDALERQYCRASHNGRGNICAEHVHAFVVKIILPTTMEGVFLGLVRGGCTIKLPCMMIWWF